MIFGFSLEVGNFRNFTRRDLFVQIGPDFLEKLQALG
jgi:hypothetical protein